MVDIFYISFLLQETAFTNNWLSHCHFSIYTCSFVLSNLAIVLLLNIVQLLELGIKLIVSLFKLLF